MIRLGKGIVKWRIPILIIGILLLIPSFFGILYTRVNYDMLDYLPSDIDTVKGQKILLEDFGKGAFSMVMVKGMEPKDVAALKTKMEAVDHVETVLWYDSLADITIPMEVLPEKVYKAFNNGDTTLMAVSSTPRPPRMRRWTPSPRSGRSPASSALSPACPRW